MNTGAPYIVGVDLGTSACKTVVFTLDVRKASSAYREYPVLHPQPRWAERNPLDWGRAVVKAMWESLRKGGVEGREIVGLSVDSKGGCSAR